MAEGDMILNRYGEAELFISDAEGKPLLSVTEVERYADAVLQRVGMTNQTPPKNGAEFQRLLMERVLPNAFGVLVDAGEIEVDEKVEQGTRAYLKMLLVASGIGATLGFNKATNEKLGDGKWTL